MNLGGGGGGDGGNTSPGSLAADQFRDGNSILWRKLATTIMGAFIAAYGVGFSAIVDAVFGLAIGGVNWVGDFLSGLLIEEPAGVVIALGTTAWDLAIGSVEGLTGLWVPIAVLAVVLAYLYLMQGGDD